MRHRERRERRERFMQLKKPIAGFAMISAIFLIVVLALLVTYMTRFTTETFSETGLTMQGVRTYYAARSGLEWASAVSLNNSACPTATGGSCAANTACFKLTQGSFTSTLYSSNVTCSSFTATEAIGYTVFNFSSQGVIGTINNPGFTIRTLTASVTNAF